MYHMQQGCTAAVHVAAVGVIRAGALSGGLAAVRLASSSLMFACMCIPCLKHAPYSLWVPALILACCLGIVQGFASTANSLATSWTTALTARTQRQSAHAAACAAASWDVRLLDRMTGSGGRIAQHSTTIMAAHSSAFWGGDCSNISSKSSCHSSMSSRQTGWCWRWSAAVAVL